MNTIRIYIAEAIWWLAHKLDDLAWWVFPPHNPDNFEIWVNDKPMTEERKQELRKWFEEN